MTDRAKDSHRAAGAKVRPRMNFTMKEDDAPPPLSFESFVNPETGEFMVYANNLLIFKIEPYHGKMTVYGSPAAGLGLSWEIERGLKLGNRERIEAK